MVPTPGRIVLYTLSLGDAEAINRRRADAVEDHAAARRSGLQAHTGNTAHAGDVYPAMVVRVWESTEESAVQLQVFLDGNDTYWATSRTQGDGELHWHEPPHV